MNSFKLAWRRLFQKGENTTTRIISLAAGLAMGLLLLVEVFYYYSYDSFYPEAHRIYTVHENFKQDNSSDQMMSYPRVSGAIAPGLKAEVPGIEAACRLNSIGGHVFYTQDKKSYKAKFSLTDEHLFEVLPRNVIQGNPVEIFKTPLNCMVSNKIAEEIGGDVVGKIITLKRYPDKELTIAGIFEALPENTNYEYDVLISMVSTKHFFRWDGSSNWLGNDRYYACVKLAPGVNPESLASAVRKMQEKNQDIIKLEEEQGGMVLKYSFVPIRKIHVDNVKDMIIILSTIAFAVLLVSLMNYILLSLSALINRAKSSAIHKACGAQARNLQKMIFTETFLLFLISIIGAGLIIFALKPFAESQLKHSLMAAFNPYVVWPLLSIIVVLIFATSYLPGKFFSRIPVATAFRNYKQKKNKWKLVLLSFQFIGASFILTLMVIVSMQYNNMKNADHGYNTEGIFYGSTTGMDGSKIATVLNKLRAIPEVEKVGLGYGLPLDGASGNNVISPDGKKELFNVADFYEADVNFLSILNIKVSEGRNFSQENSAPNDLIISKKGAEMLKLNNGWTSGVVGKPITITEHGASTISGVFPDFIINSIANPDFRPAVFFYKPEEQFMQEKIENPAVSFRILLKVYPNAQLGIHKKITDAFNLALPNNDADIKNLEDELQNNYVSEKGFRNAMMAGNVVILLITIIGLIGYTTNEANRRRKELAIRKINGANLSNILRSFIIDLEYVAIPGVILGLIGAWLTVDKWMQNFSAKIPLHWGIFAFCSFLILFLVAAIAVANYYKSASQNPVESLRYE